MDLLVLLPLLLVIGGFVAYIVRSQSKNEPRVAGSNQPLRAEMAGYSDRPQLSTGLTPFVAMTIGGVVLTPLVWWFGGLALALIPVLIMIGGVVGLIVRASARPTAARPLGPIAHTDDGRPIYPVVGYTSDGTPITGDRAVGYQSANPRTNSLAIVALVLAFVFPLLAIPFGHIARRQIRTTGEQGDGIALAGLIVAYLSVAIGLVAIAVVAIMASQT